MSLFFMGLCLDQVCISLFLKVSLNEGAHQLRLYGQGPNGVDPMSESCLRNAGVRIIPCASVLIRVTKVPRGSGGKALEVGIQTE